MGRERKGRMLATGSGGKCRGFEICLTKSKSQLRILLLLALWFRIPQASVSLYVQRSPFRVIRMKSHVQEMPGQCLLCNSHLINVNSLWILPECLTSLPWLHNCWRTGCVRLFRIIIYSSLTKTKSFVFLGGGKEKKVLEGIQVIQWK